MTDWHERWNEGRIGFHLPDVNETLVKYHKRLLAEPGRVLVPLAGKTLDMTFLAEQGHEAVGVELVEKAARAYFEDHKLVPAVHEAPHLLMEAGGVEMHVADFFDVEDASLAPVDAIWDRAAMVALDAPTRERYAARLKGLLPRGRRLLLVTFAYDQSAIDGPPFSVPDEEVERHYAGAGKLERLEHKVDQGPGRFQELGIEITESVWLLERA